jgi:hypothetical protein
VSAKREAEGVSSIKEQDVSHGSEIKKQAYGKAECKGKSRIEVTGGSQIEIDGKTKRIQRKNGNE